mmetsp:Transcript_37668/g.83882  ORF Transcript_37668/g.83882 Transcript_37668/m.83882 type:complete len:84 (+) Transcript_37668:112-363(+)
MGSGLLKQQVTSDGANVALIIVCFLFPPIAVIIKKNAIKDYNVVIDLLLTLLGFLPGCIFAVYVVFKYWKGCDRGENALPFLP